MSDARHDQKVIDSIASTEAFEALARSCGMDKETFLREWNKGAAYADKHWADTPNHEDSRTVRRGIYGPETLPKRGL